MSQLRLTKIKFPQKIQLGDREKGSEAPLFLNSLSNESFSQRKCYGVTQFLDPLKQLACHCFRSSVFLCLFYYQ